MGIGIARTRRRAAGALFERLALTAVPKGAMDDLSRRGRRIGYAYVVFGATITGLNLARIAIGDSERAGAIVTAVIVVVVGLGLVLMVVALWQVSTMSAQTFGPLGLTLVALPRIHVSVLAGRSWVTGSVAYGGTRHGRAVSIAQHVHGAATLVSSVSPSALRAVRVPTNPAEMAAATGESIRNWRHVEVMVDGGTVGVLRTGRQAGSWMLHDLLLAEVVADSIQLRPGS